MDVIQASPVETKPLLRGNKLASASKERTSSRNGGRVIACGPAFSDAGVAASTTGFSSTGLTPSGATTGAASGGGGTGGAADRAGEAGAAAAGFIFCSIAI